MQNYEVKEVKGTNGLYAVDSNGDVLSYNNNGYGLREEPVKMKCSITHNGYKRVLLQGKQHFVHRLVYEAFFGEIPVGMQINHKSEDKLDNRPENLELLSPKDNSNYGTRNKRISEAKLKFNYARKPIRLFNENFDKSFISFASASRYFNLKTNEIKDKVNNAKRTNKNFITIGGERYYTEL